MLQRVLQACPTGLRRRPVPRMLEGTRREEECGAGEVGWEEEEHGEGEAERKEEEEA